MESVLYLYPISEHGPWGWLRGGVRGAADVQKIVRFSTLGCSRIVNTHLPTRQKTTDGLQQGRLAFRDLVRSYVYIRLSTLDDQYLKSSSTSTKHSPRRRWLRPPSNHLFTFQNAAHPPLRANRPGFAESPPLSSSRSTHRLLHFTLRYLADVPLFRLHASPVSESASTEQGLLHAASEAGPQTTSSRTSFPCRDDHSAFWDAFSAPWYFSKHLARLPPRIDRLAGDLELDAGLGEAGKV